MTEGYDINWIAALIVAGVGFAAIGGLFAVSWLVAPKRPSEAKDMPYECGIPPAPFMWSQIQIRYYVFAILFLIFDVEAVFLFPWALVFLKTIPGGVLRNAHIHRNPVLRRHLRLAQGGVAVEMKPEQQTGDAGSGAALSRPLPMALSPELGQGYEAGQGNSPADSVFNRALPNALTAKSDELFALARKNSLWTLSFGLACCAIEMMSTHMSHHDFDRFGIVTWPSPRQADVMIVAGTVVKKMAEPIKLLYEQMPDPKWVIAMGSCATNGGPYYRSYSVVMGVDHLIPVDVYVPGCPPRPEALMHGIMQLQEKIQKDAAQRGAAS